jgi:hypothetical protein
MAVSSRREAAPEANGRALKAPLLSAEAPSAEDSVPLVEGMPPLWPDEAAESEFRAEARARGEVVVSAKPRDDDEQADAKVLPPLDDLVKRIPANVREVLDELFRARFVTVKRVPKSALKQYDRG